MLKRAHIGYLILALLFFVFSKIVAAFRLNLYFYQIGLPLATRSNLQLYLLGMFYNLFLPGGIGGDAYKGYLLNRTFGTSGKKLASVLLLDRISGLFLLFLYSGVLLLWMSEPWLVPWRPWVFIVLLMGLAVYWYAHQKGFPYLSGVFWNSIGYSSIVQLAQLSSVFFILLALGVTEDRIPYLFVFLLSSIVAVLPITIGGIGSREVVFYDGAQWLGLQQETSIGVSMAFFLITALVSLCGIYYHFRKPVLLLHGNQQV